MDFSYWLILNENAEQNWDIWCDNLEKYAQNNPRENRVLNSLKDILGFNVHGFLDLKILISPTNATASGRVQARQIISVLKEKNVENYNWFAFSMGFIVSYGSITIHEEDLRAAIDETKRRISSGELPKAEIGEKGWLVVGSESKTHVDAAIERNQQISKREQERLKKSGKTLDEDPRLITIVAKEADYTLYFCPKITSSFREKLINERHMILCKYGKGGKFCTADPGGTYHRSYANNDIYIFHVNDQVKYQFVSCEDATNHQFMDIENRPPDEVLSREYDFLINHGAPISCYELPVVDRNSYEDLIYKILSGNLERITLPIIEKSLFRAVSEKDIDSIELFLNAAVNIARANLDRRIRLSSILEDIEESFLQKVIKKILDVLAKKRINALMFDNSTLIDIVKMSNLENLETISSDESLTFNLFSRLGPEVQEIAEKFNYSLDILKILIKVKANLPIVKTILLSKDKEKIINLFKQSGMLESRLTKSGIEDLLMCNFPGGDAHTKIWRTSDWMSGSTNKTEIKVSYTPGKQMASMLGSEIVSRLDLKKGPLYANMDSVRMGKSSFIRWHRVDITEEQAKGFLEGIAAKHDNMDGEDVYNLIRKYKQLNIHKAEEKITALLGKRKMALLNKHHRSSLRVNY